MTYPLRLLVIVWLATVAWMTAAPLSYAAQGKDPRIDAELVSMSQWVTPGSTAIVAIRQDIAPGWHTYWRNPGDSGGATEAVWTVPEGFRVGDFVWPLPRRKALMGLMSYVYSDTVYLPVPVEIPPGLTAGTTYPVSAQVLFLVCSDQMCVPVEMTLETRLKVGQGAAPLDPAHGKAIEDVVTGAPRPAAIDARASVRDGRLEISAIGGPLAGLRPRRAYFFAYDQMTLDHAAVQSAQAGVEGLSFSIPAGRALRNGVTAPVSGVIATDLGAWEITASPGHALAGTTGTRLDTAEEASAPAAGFLQALLFAFVGGLILNLMPCVFPVLAMKAAALSRVAHDPDGLRKDGLAFALGVLVSFAALAGLLLALRAVGKGVGWGFQLQSPAVIAGLALLMLAVALNLSGVFHFGGRLQQLGQWNGHRSNRIGAFLTGVLAVVVAAPCTAPFMAVAIGAALLLDWPLALGIFLMLGAGLALPYLLLSFSPGLLRRLPRPGPWMERLRNILALPMYATTLWLVWVFARQTGNQPGWLLAAAALLAVALWLYGRGQTRGLNLTLRLVAGAVVVLLAASVFMAFRTSVVAVEATPRTALPSQPWSEATLASARASGKPVVVNFTADWCVTCKINERTALSSERTARAFANADVVYLVGDWTRADPAITAELQRHGRSGVPLYLVYAPGQEAPTILPQILTEGVVIEAVRKAGGR